MFGRRGIEKDRHRASSEIRQSIACAEAGALATAMIHSRRAEDCIDRLMRHEPDGLYHRLVLAGLLYNRATILDGLGEGDDSLAAARTANELYEDFDPSHGDPSAVAPLLREFRSDSQEVETLMAQAADARARFARLLAKYDGRSAVEAVHRHGSAAVQTYQALVRAGHHFGQSDVARVTDQYDAAKNHLRELDR
ncbi:hypothetical protein [Actinophytocola sp. NPDC049390]|uniref:hypothetical protein n=1 Tax=Actinophytocola sp. NPDC049390 TaxID=3363894 RepID=UPI00378F7484